MGEPNDDRSVLERETDELARLRAELAEARLWARAYRTYDVERGWSGTWGVALEGVIEGPGLAAPPAWLLEPLPFPTPER